MDLLGYRCNCTSVVKVYGCLRRTIGLASWVAARRRFRLSSDSLRFSKRFVFKRFERRKGAHMLRGECQRPTTKNFLDIGYRSKVGDDEKSQEMRGGKGRAPL